MGHCPQMTSNPSLLSPKVLPVHPGILQVAGETQAVTNGCGELGRMFLQGAQESGVPPWGEDRLSSPEEKDNLRKMLLQIPNVVRAEMAVREPVPAGWLLYMHLLTFLKPGLHRKDILMASEVCRAIPPSPFQA